MEFPRDSTTPHEKGCVETDQFTETLADVRWVISVAHATSFRGTRTVFVVGFGNKQHVREMRNRSCLLNVFCGDLHWDDCIVRSDRDPPGIPSSDGTFSAIIFETGDASRKMWPKKCQTCFFFPGHSVRSNGSFE